MKLYIYDIKQFPQELVTIKGKKKVPKKIIKRINAINTKGRNNAIRRNNVTIKVE